MKKNIVHHNVTIFNSSYVVISDEDEAKVLQAAAVIDAMMKDIAAKSRLQDAYKIAVLAALQCAHKMLDFELLIENKKEYESSLINRINQEIERFTAL